MSVKASTNARTLAAYQAAAEVYERAEAAVNPPALTALLDAFSDRLAAGTTVLEFGSATGRDAAFLERRGLRVHRTDVTMAFVDRLRARGLNAEPLNVLSDDIGGPWSAMYAGAVFLHFSEAELVQVSQEQRPRRSPGDCWRSLSKRATARAGPPPSLTNRGTSPTGANQSCAR